jgi:hypothetical protein
MKEYKLRDVCDELQISNWTLRNWYMWETKALADGIITEAQLPQPIRLEHTKGTPRIWTEEMVEQLKEFQRNIVSGRNGIFGVYSNPNYKNTKKYAKLIGENNGTE